VKIGLNRRSLIKTTAAAAAAAVGSLGSQSLQAATTAEPEIKFAGYDYDRIRAIVDGRVSLPGASVAYEFEDIYTLNQYAFGSEPEYTVTEVGLIPYVTKFANEDFRAYTLIPVFVSRTFRHRNIFAHVDAGIDKPGDLKGKRIGAPGYGSSANTWIRGLLLDEYGIKPEEMQWIETTKSSDQGAVTSGGGFSAFDGGDSPYFLPADFPLVQGPAGVDESELLLSGGCDALIAPITPTAFLDANPKIRRLFPDVRAAEQKYFRKTGVFPIMHVVAIHSDAIKAAPHLPAAVFEMYAQAKQLAYADLETSISLKVTLPWVAQELEDTRELMGRDFWRYGIEANRKELELVMRYTHEQGLVKARGNVTDMFDPSTLTLRG